GSERTPGMESKDNLSTSPATPEKAAPRHRESNDAGSIHAEAADILKQAHLQRQRLWRIRRLLKKRWHRAWARERAAFQQRHDETSRRQAALEKKSEFLLQRQSAFNQERLRFTSDMELSQRHLQAERTDIRRRQDQLTDDHRKLEERAR